MATSINCGPAWLMDGPTYDGQYVRTNHVAASFFNTGSAQVRGGVLPSGGQLAVTAASGMSVNVATGYALCPASAGSTEGGYLFGLMTAGSLTVASSDPTNPRIDLVCAYANDLGSASSAGFVEILTGTPTAGATLSNLDGAPSLPSNAIVLAYLQVPANSVAVTNANITTWSLLWTVAQGGIMPVNSATAAAAPGGYTGMYVHDLTSGRLMHNPASGPVQPRILPFAPQLARVTANTIAVPAPLSGSTIAQLTFTCDGNTDIKIFAHWPGLYSHNSLGTDYRIALTFQIDGTAVSTTYAWNKADDGKTRGGGDMTHFTQSGVDRPAAGTHTIILNGQTLDTTSACDVAATSSQPILLRVRPVVL